MNTPENIIAITLTINEQILRGEITKYEGVRALVRATRITDLAICEALLALATG
jgi:hypothetical protein